MDTQKPTSNSNTSTSAERTNGLKTGYVASKDDADDFVFRPMTEGLGFHKRASSVDVERDVEDLFTFGPITSLGSNDLASDHFGGRLASPDSEAARSMLQHDRAGVSSNVAFTSNTGTPDVFGRGETSKSATPSTSSESRQPLNASTSSDTVSMSSDLTSRAKPRHNSKSVSELIAALPPAMDFLDEKELTSAPASSLTIKSSMASGAVRQSTSPSPSGPATFGPEKKSWLNLPLGRTDYSPPKSLPQTPSIDENLAKAFPHLSRMSRQATKSANEAISAGVSAPTAATVAAASALGLEGENAALTMSQVKSSLSSENSSDRSLAIHVGAAILDGLVVMGVTCIMLSIVLGITGANLIALLENTTTNFTTGGVLLGLFVVSYLLYVLVARAFFSATLGEWSYEVRVGRTIQRQRWYYPLQILWRGSLAMATGIVVLPILSALVGRDLFYYLTGLEIVSLTDNVGDR